MKNLLIKSFKGVTGKQKAFFFTLLQNDYNLTKTCEYYSMNTDTYYRWMQKPEIRAYRDFVISLYTEAHDLVVWKALMEAVEKGDVKAMRTYFEIKGKLKPTQTNIDAKNIQYQVRFSNSRLGDKVLSTSESKRNSPESD